MDAAKLYWGDTVTVEGYVIKAEDFNEEKHGVRFDLKGWGKTKDCSSFRRLGSRI